MPLKSFMYKICSSLFFKISLNCCSLLCCLIKHVILLKGALALEFKRFIFFNQVWGSEQLYGNVLSYINGKFHSDVLCYS